MQLEISHNSLEFANVQAILNTALGQPVFLKYLRRYPTFRPPKLFFIVDFFEFTKQYEIQMFVSGQHKQMQGSLLAPEMYFKASNKAHRLLMYTGLPQSYQPSPEIGIEIEVQNVFLLYDAEVVLNQPNQPISETCKSDIEMTYQNVARSSKFHAQDLADKMRELNDYSIDIENKIFKEYRQLLEALQMRTQFVMNSLQSAYLGFKRQGERAEAILKNLDQFDTVQSIAESQMGISRKFVAEFKLSSKYDMQKPAEQAAEPQTDQLVQFFNEKRSDFIPNFKLQASTRIDYNYPANSERAYTQYSKIRLVQDYENWLLEKGRINADFQKLQLTGTLKNYKDGTQEQDQDPLRTAQLEAIRQTQRQEVLGELQGQLAASFVTVQRPPLQSTIAQADDQKLRENGEKPLELSQAEEDAPEVDQLKDYSGIQSPAQVRLIPQQKNELTTQTTQKTAGLIQTKLDKFSIATKAQAVRKIMLEFAVPSIPEFQLKEYEDVFLLMCYHFAKLRQSKSLANLSFRKRRNFNSDNLCVVLELAGEMTFLLVAGNEGYSPKAVLYQKGAFQELGDCKVNVGSVEAVGCSLKGKVLNVGGEATGFEKGLAYDVAVAL